MCREQNAGQHHNTMTDNKSFEIVERFKYLGTTQTHQICIREEIMLIFQSKRLCVTKEYLLSFIAEYFFFQFDIQKHEY
jgi:hypothetical protein